jgi:phage terminase large subunit
MNDRPISILLFADSILGIKTLYDWQCNALLSFESGKPTAIAVCNNGGKTSTVYPAAALWCLYSWPKARIVYLSSTFKQVREQFFSNLTRFRYQQAFAGWTWLDTEIRTPQGGYITGKSSDTGGHVEGHHSRPDSPAAILVDEAKSVDEEIFEALSRCTATYRLYGSSTGPAFGYFHSLFASRSEYWNTYRIRSTDCAHISQSSIDADREADGEHSSTFRIKHLSEFLYDSGQSVVSLEHVRNLLADPPVFTPGPVSAFADFAAGGDENVLSICRGNSVEVADAWRSKDTMSTIGRFINNFQKHSLRDFEVAGDAGGMGVVMLDRLSESGFRLKHVHNGAPAQRSESFADFAAEAWATVAQLIERKLIRLPADERLVAQLTSRQRRYDSHGRLRLEPKSDMAARGVESPDRADAIIGAVMMRLTADPYAFDPAGRQQYSALLAQCARQMERQRSPFAVEHVNFSGW